MSINRIGNASYLLPSQQCTRLSLMLEPMTTGNEINRTAFKHPLFPSPYSGRQVIGRTFTRQQAAIATVSSEVTAAEGEVAYRGSRPDVVHSPYYRLATFKNLADSIQREHPLINPVQMNDVSLFKLSETGNIRASICQVDLKKMFSRESAMEEDHNTLPKKMPVEHW